ncbi:MAG: hypothetical protein IPK74_10265 [Deltaproteobacteria bacterium]|nr:hypothetical protein [Deltaproteobacteria bacterium]
MIARTAQFVGAASLALAVAVSPLPSFAAQSSAATSNTTQTCKSGEELFRGLFYGEGASAALIREIADPGALDAAQTKKSRLTVAQSKRLLQAQHDKLVAAGRTADAALVAIAIAGLAKRTDDSALLMQGTPNATGLSEASRQIIEMIKTRDATFFAGFAADLQSGDPVKVNRALRKGWQRNSEMIQLLGGGGGGSSADEPGHGVDQDSSVVLWIGIALVLLVWIALPLTTESFTGLAHDEAVARLTEKLACTAP